MSQIEVIVNKQATKFSKAPTVMELILERGLKKTATAVWINGQSLLLANYETHLLKDGDQINLVYMRGGG